MFNDKVKLCLWFFAKPRCHKCIDDQLCCLFSHGSNEKNAQIWGFTSRDRKERSFCVEWSFDVKLLSCCGFQWLFGFLPMFIWVFHLSRLSKSTKSTDRQQESSFANDINHFVMSKFCYDNSSLSKFCKKLHLWAESLWKINQFPSRNACRFLCFFRSNDVLLKKTSPSMERFKYIASDCQTLEVWLYTAP